MLVADFIDHDHREATLSDIESKVSIVTIGDDYVGLEFANDLPQARRRMQWVEGAIDPACLKHSECGANRALTVGQKKWNWGFANASFRKDVMSNSVSELIQLTVRPALASIR